MSLGKVRGNKNPLASLGVQPQCFLTQMQLKSIPHDMTDSASLECSPTIFCPRMFHLFFFFFFLSFIVPSAHDLCRSQHQFSFGTGYFSGGFAGCGSYWVSVKSQESSSFLCRSSCRDQESIPLSVFRTSVTAAE